MKRGFFLSLAIVVAWSFPAAAQTSCYRPEHVRAEQLLRLHSELLVIALTCRQGSDGADLAHEYHAFTKKNLPLLRSAERTMMTFYKTSSKDDPIERLDRLRTRLGNEFGQKAATMSSPVFCSHYRDKVALLRGASLAEIEKHVHRFEASGRSYEKICETLTVVGKRR